MLVAEEALVHFAASHSKMREFADVKRTRASDAQDKLAAYLQKSSPQLSEIVMQPAAVVDDALQRELRANPAAIAIAAWDKCGGNERQALIRRFVQRSDDEEELLTMLDEAAVRCDAHGLANLPVELAAAIAENRYGTTTANETRSE